MKVILLEDVKSLGKKGDIVSVSDGYARNFVLPKHVGVEATEKNKNELKLQKQHEDKLAAERLAEAKALAHKLEGLKIEVTMKAGENGKVFGSVASKEIAEQAKKQHGLELTLTISPFLPRDFTSSNRITFMIFPPVCNL